MKGQIQILKYQEAASKQKTAVWRGSLWASMGQPGTVEQEKGYAQTNSSNQSIFTQYKGFFT